MKDKILEVLKLTRNNALNMEEIYNKIYHNEIDMNILNSLKEEINKLQEEHLVYCVNSKKGLYTLKSIKELIKREHVKMPIVDLISDIIIGNKLVQHDFDITAGGHPKGYISKELGREFFSNNKLINK